MHDYFSQVRHDPYWLHLNKEKKLVFNFYNVNRSDICYLEDMIYDWFERFCERNDLATIDTREFWDEFHDFFMDTVMRNHYGIHGHFINIYGKFPSTRKLNEQELIRAIRNRISRSEDAVAALNQVLDQNNSIKNVECLQDFKSKYKRHYSPFNIASIANEYFISRMNPDYIVQEKRWPNTFKPFELRREHVHGAIVNLKTPYASGILLMSGEMLQITLGASVEVLYHIFKRSIAQGVLPIDWRYTVVTLKHKDGAKDQIENYRPIGTTCVPSKV